MLKTYHIKTFGCQMNYADSEKIDMILRSAGLRKVIDPTIADIIIMNTCSVRQKGEDRVFGFMNEISRFHKNNNTDKAPLFGITGCMVRKSGIARKYLLKKIEEIRIQNNKSMKAQNRESEGDKLFESDESKGQMSGANEFLSPSGAFGTFQSGKVQNKENKSIYISKDYKRKSAEKITLLESAENLSNYDDELFLRSPLIDFVFRIEEVSFLSKILSLITGENIGNDAKWNEYLAVKQLQENPANANIIIQTGCDNFCTFCIVPHTRGREISRPMGEIIDEIKETVRNGTKEVTLLGQNVNSYGKETKGKLWDIEEMRWIQTPFVKGGRGDLSHTTHIPYREDLKEKARELRKNMTGPEKQLWYQVLSSDKLGGFRFLRQKPFLDFIVDFYCDELALAIEIDGESHVGQEEYDKKRSQELGEFGITVIRFTNDEVLGNLEGVRENILQCIQNRKSSVTSGQLLYKGASKILRPTGTSFTKEVFQTPFRELLENINTIDGLDRIRFTSSNPHDMTRDILDAHFELSKMCPYLHFALQSGSDTMLRRMNRKHTYEDFKTQLKYLRSRDPLFSISTDIIVGFPGETEEEFQETVQAMKECEFDFAYIARYSSRSGTIATTKYKDDISPEEKARRWTILNNILRESVERRAKLMIGREEVIIISGKGKDDTWVGRTRNFKEVFIPDNGDIKIGESVRVKIDSFDKWVLRGVQV